MLRRHDAAKRVALVLATLTRSVRDDANAFLAAQDDVERQRAALLLLLRTPGMRLAVWGLEDDWAPSDEPRRQYRDFAGYWWCSATPQTWSPAPLTKFLYGNTAPQSTFIAPADRATAASELKELQRASSATEFLAREAIQWARATPGDPRTAEALSRVVRGGRYSRCPRRDGPEARDSGLPLAQRAFVLLHRLHPQSEWAKRTKYWYDSDY